MKRIFALCLVLAMAVTTGNAAFTESKTEKKENYGAFKNAETKAAAEIFVKMSRHDYEQLTGKHLSLVERAAFKIQQKRMKKELQRATEGSTESKLIGFIAGFALFLIGVLLVYLLSDDPTMRTWSLIGALVSLLWLGVLIF